MKIHKILNNNAVVCINENNNSIVVTGRGIAFGKKSGDNIEKNDTTKIYTLSDSSLDAKFQQIAERIPIDYIEISSQIIDYAKRTLKNNFSDIVYITLPDHLYGSVQRYEQGIKLENKLLFDIKRIYSSEYKVGLMAIKKLEASYNIEFMPDEAAFIAQHFVNAEMGKDFSDVPNMTEIIHGILDIVKFYFGIVFDEDSISYDRFLTHLKFFCYRMQKDGSEDKAAVDLLPVIELKFPKVKGCVDKIEYMLQSKYNYQLHEDEKTYLIMHINRILQDSL